MRTLYLAAGGGGDALGVLLVRGLIGPLNAEPPLIATYAWERLQVDPEPGPRGVNGFSNLKLLGGLPVEIVPTSDTKPRGRSTLPRLAGCTNGRLFLLDPSTGAVGMRKQIRHLVKHLDVQRVTVLDIGGDVVAAGSEPHLLSPLADALALAACRDLVVPVDVSVAGPALDGELDEATTFRNFREVGAVCIGEIGPHDYYSVRDIFVWHPTEATAVLAAAGLGVRGIVEIRRKSIIVHLTDTSASVWRATLDAVAKHSVIVDALSETSSLRQVEDVVQRTAVSELDRERDKATKLRGVASTREPTIVRKRVVQYTTEAQNRGIDLITNRRLAEATELPDFSVDDFKMALGLPNNAGMRGPLWDVHTLVCLED